MKNNNAVPARLAGGIRIPTVGSADYSTTDFAPFEGFARYLEHSYPRLYSAVRVERVNGHSLLFRWEGKDPSRKPLLFLSHYDVVPGGKAESPSGDIIFNPDDPPLEPVRETQRRWEYPPFSGAVAKGRIYGRGALDMKGMLFAVLEAADRLLDEGFRPAQDIWFAFGHDEETGGVHGALKIAEYLASRELVFDAVFDEGGVIGTEGAVGGSLSRPIAVVGLGEKGFLTLGITVRGTGGHSSMPPAESALVLASEIVLRLNAQQMPVRITPPVAAFFKSLQSAGLDVGVREAGKERDALPAGLSGIPFFNSLTRTTTAVTMMRGSDAANVLSSTAEIVANFRIIHGDTVQDVIDHVAALCKDYDVDITVLGSAREPSGLTPEDSKGMKAIRDAVKSVYPDALVAPCLTVGGTDAYKYQAVSEHIYRFMPIRLNAYEIGTIHSENEYIAIENYRNMIAYFYRIMSTYETYT